MIIFTTKTTCLKCLILTCFLSCKSRSHGIRTVINKGIEFIDLPPIICYKYNKPIRNTVFNFNKLVSDLDIRANTPEL